MNAADYDLWRSTFGSTINLLADAHKNGVVDASDYNIWRNSLVGGGASLGLHASVPEPGSLTLVLIGVCLGGRRATTLRGWTRKS